MKRIYANLSKIGKGITIGVGRTLRWDQAYRTRRPVFRRLCNLNAMESEISAA
jgi:hypothetical protein